MFNKIKIKNFKRKIDKISDVNYLEQIYLNSSKEIKNDREICDIIYKKSKDLLKILPIDYQLDILKNYDTELLLGSVSKEAQLEFLRKKIDVTTISDDVILFYINNYPENIIDYALNNMQIFISNTISNTTKNDLIRLIKSNGLLEKIIKESPITNNIELFNYCIYLDNSLLKKVSKEIRIKYFLSKIGHVEINQNCLNLFNYLTNEEKEFVFLEIIKKFKIDINQSVIKSMLNNMPIESQKRMASNDFLLLKYCDKQVQLDFVARDEKLLIYTNNDVKKESIAKNINLIYLLKESTTSYTESFKLLNEIDANNFDIINALKSPIFNAKGSLLNIPSTNGEYDMLFGINQYTKSQYNFFNKLSDKQLAELCMYDVNYILILANTNLENFENSKKRIKNIFKYMFGESLLEKYTKIIDYILDNYKFDSHNNANCILDSLKLIFNKDIIKNNNIEIIYDYINSNINKNTNTDLFNLIIKNTYGEDAGNILKSRPRLNEHNINSLEIFNPIIIEKFGIGLIHDLISYNISNMSYFLSLIKDSEKISALSTLYNLESKIYGKNIATFEKTINDYIKMDKLLENIDGNNLNNEELNNLYNIIINGNYGNITNKGQLVNYEKYVKDKLLNDINDVNDIEYIKEKICNAIFGINYNYNYNVDNHKQNAHSILYLYTASSDYDNLLSDNEKAMFNLLEIIKHESDKDKLIEIINDLFKNQNILSNVEFVNAYNKLIHHQEKLLNDSLISIEKLENELSKNNNKVLKIHKNGVPIYILNGMDFNLLEHNIGGNNNSYIYDSINSGNPLNNIDSFEEQYGSSTISMWYKRSNQEYKKYDSDRLTALLGFGYFSVPKDSIVGMNVGDVSTDHGSKLASSIAKGAINFNAVSKSNRDSEISIYRKIRNQELISNNNSGGRFDFDYFCGSIYLSNLCNINQLKLEGLGFDVFDEAKKRGKPIILINNYAYLKNNKNIYRDNYEIKR